MTSPSSISSVGQWAYATTTSTSGIATYNYGFTVAMRTEARYHFCSHVCNHTYWRNTGIAHIDGDNILDEYACIECGCAILVDRTKPLTMHDAYFIGLPADVPQYVQMYLVTEVLDK